MNPAELCYRKTAVAAVGNGLSLLIALYDTLAGDLRRAAEAERRGDIEQRCREINHALLVIGYLEDWLSRGSSGQLSDQLRGMYASLRRGLIQAQIRRSAAMIEEQMTLVLNVRAVWQGMEMRAASSGPEVLPPLPSPPANGLFSGDCSQVSWSA